MARAGSSLATTAPWNVVTASPGTYTMTGTDATTVQVHNALNATTGGSYAMTGTDATLTYSGASAGGAVLTAGETDALGIDFTYHTDRTKQMSVKDSGTPANVGDFDPYTKLTYTSPSLKLCRQSDGVWRYGNHNLALQSQTMTTSPWTDFNTDAASVANSTTAPDGSSTAETIKLGVAAGSQVYQTITVPAASHTLSMWVKHEGTGVTTFRLKYYDGSADNFSSDKTATGSWQRFTYTFTGSNSASGNIAIHSNAAAQKGYFYVWGVELKRNPVAESAGYAAGTYSAAAGGYIATTASAVYDLPYEWDASNASQGLLIEEARTNLILRSQEYGNAAYSSNNISSISTDNTTAPDGTTTAERILINTTNGTHSRYQAVTSSASTNYAWSVFVKKDTHRYVNLVLSTSSTDWTAAIFDLNGGTAATQTGHGATGTSVSSAQVDAGNGWYRLTLVGTTGGTNAACVLGFCSAATGVTLGSFGEEVWAPAGTEAVWAWGSQMEAGSFATSPIHTISATVTRAADQLSTASNFPAPSTAATLAVQVNPLVTLASNFYTPLQLYADSSNHMWLPQRQSNANWIGVLTRAGSQEVNIAGATATAGTTSKCALGVASNDAAFYVGGVQIGTDATCTLPASMVNLRIGWEVGGSLQANAHITKLIVFTRRMNNTELATWTT